MRPVAAIMTVYAVFIVSFSVLFSASARGICRDDTPMAPGLESRS